MAKRSLRGAGPWEFQPDGPLEPGDTMRLDLRNMTYNGRKGFFCEHRPLDDALVTNKSTQAALRVEMNNLYGGQVQANSQQPFTDAGVTYLEVTNISDSTTVAADEVVVELSDSGFDADDQAREKKARQMGRSPLERVVRDLVPGGESL